jgi:hypothetical protein
MKSQFTNDQINEVMEKRGCARRAALRWLNRNREDRPKVRATAAPAKVDGKQAAANDKPEPTTSLTPEERGKARAEGLRLHSLAGKPKKSDFVRVFGKKGVAWTWESRAKALGIASAEECAAKFQSLLKKAAR